MQQLTKSFPSPVVDEYGCHSPAKSTPAGGVKTTERSTQSDRYQVHMFTFTDQHGSSLLAELESLVLLLGRCLRHSHHFRHISFPLVSV